MKARYNARLETGRCVFGRARTGAGPASFTAEAASLRYLLPPTPLVVGLELPLIDVVLLCVRTGAGAASFTAGAASLRYLLLRHRPVPEAGMYLKCIQRGVMGFWKLFKRRGKKGRKSMEMERKIYK